MEQFDFDEFEEQHSMTDDQVYLQQKSILSGIFAVES